MAPSSKPRPIESTDPLATATVTESAHRLRISPWQLYKMLKNGSGPPYTKIGSSPRIRVVDLERWLTQGGEGSPANERWIAEWRAARDGEAARSG